MTPYSYPGINFKYKDQSTIEAVKKIVCKNYGRTFDEIDVTSRTREIVQVRQALMYWLRKYTHMSLNDIGSIFQKNYDHSTILWAVKTYENVYPQIMNYKTYHKKTKEDILRILK